MLIPTANTHAAASKGETGPKPKVPARVFATSPATIAIKPLPKKIALENVSDNHCASNPLCIIEHPQDDVRKFRRMNSYRKCFLLQLRVNLIAYSTNTPQKLSYLEMLSHKPRLKWWEKQWCGDASQHTSQHQHSVLWRMLRETAQNVRNAVEDTHPLAPTVNRHSTDLVRKVAKFKKQNTTAAMIVSIETLIKMNSFLDFIAVLETIEGF